MTGWTTKEGYDIIKINLENTEPIFADILWRPDSMLNQKLRVV